MTKTNWLTWMNARVAHLRSGTAQAKSKVIDDLLELAKVLNRRDANTTIEDELKIAGPTGLKCLNTVTDRPLPAGTRVEIGNVALPGKPPKYRFVFMLPDEEGDA